MITDRGVSGDRWREGVFPVSLAWGRQASAREGKVKASELASRDRGGGWARDVTVWE